MHLRAARCLRVPCAEGSAACPGRARDAQHHGHAGTFVVRFSHPFYTHCRAVGSAGEVLCSSLRGNLGIIAPCKIKLLRIKL